MEVNNLTLSPDQSHLLGTDQKGYLYVWPFKEILVSIDFLKKI